MTPADIINAIGNGGFAIILFIIIWLQWRESIRVSVEHHSEMQDLRDQQMRNVSKIARLEAQIELLMALRTDLKSSKLPDQQPPDELLPALRQPTK